jgi:hypothetical protein
MTLLTQTTQQARAYAQAHAKAWRQPTYDHQMSKLERAKQYLAQRQHAHPEWFVPKQTTLPLDGGGVQHIPV